MKTTQYQPKTGKPCGCKRGVQRDNCPQCEGTGMRIDFAAIRERTASVMAKKAEHRGQIDSIVELAEAFSSARDVQDEARWEAAEQAIREDALEVCVRSGWVAQLDKETKPEEFVILLATGGPAYRLVGSLEDGQPESVRLDHQNWGTPWTKVELTPEENSAALTYASVFYFGE
jgi:hypothetical protein